jgi:xylan 1,4-beta-xylosidase
MALSVKITVEADATIGPWRQIYRFFGCDEINYAYMKDGKRLLSKLGSLGPQQVFMRSHNQFCTGNGTHALKWGSTNAYTETGDGNSIYDWKILDEVYDSYLEANVKPYVQFGFMPKALSTHPEPYQHSWTPTAPYQEIFTGWTYPPKDYAKWGELCYQWTKHCVERYGREMCEGWWWETWNEPDIGYWSGTAKEFSMLHDYTVAAVRKALPSARVGGPETTNGGPKYLRDFLQHCLEGTNAATGEKGTPVDFVSFHAKGLPTYVDDPGHVRMGISAHLQGIDTSLAVIASFPEYKDKPVVIGESDPDGGAAAQGNHLLYRNGTMYSSYTAASFARKHDLADKHGSNLQGAVTWAFEFEDQPFYAGFRVLATNDIDLPVLNVFRMFAKMGGQRVKCESSHQISLDQILEDGVRGDPDIGAIASNDDGKLCIMVWHYHDDDVSGPIASVSLHVPGISQVKRLTHFRVDEVHSNSYMHWRKTGSPQNPTSEQYQQLQEAGALAVYSGHTKVSDEAGHVALDFELPRQGVSLLLLD